MKTQMSKMSSKRSQLTLTPCCTTVVHWYWSCVCAGGQAGNIRSRFEKMASQEQEVCAYVCTWVLGSLKSTFVY